MTFAEYRRLPLKEFVGSYDLAFIHFIDEEKFREGPIIITEQTDYFQVELYFLSRLAKYLFKRHRVLKEYFLHCQHTGKNAEEVGSKYDEELIDFSLRNEFLAKKMYHLDSTNKLEDLVKKFDELPPEEDYSNTIGKDKVIWLQELGILDHLRKQEPFNFSTNKMAQALSAITGIPSSTLVSYLSPIYSPTADQKNNPLAVDKKVKKVRLKLTEIGYISPEST